LTKGRSKPEPKTLFTTARLQKGTDVSILYVINILSSRDIIATVRLNRILPLAVFFFRSFTPTPTRQVDAGFQDVLPSLSTLQIRSTRNRVLRITLRTVTTASATHSSPYTLWTPPHTNCSDQQLLFYPITYL
jgi:hypothetical protein